MIEKCTTHGNVIEMLISLRRSFIFVANTKTASTSIEHGLQKHCEIRLRNQSHGKHWTVAQIERAFSPMFEAMGKSLDSFTKFGVIREPADWLFSWYRYRQRDGVPPESSTSGLTFEQFIEELMRSGKRKPYAKLNGQSNKFTDSEGEFALDELIPFESFPEEIARLLGTLGVSDVPDFSSIKKNQSPEKAAKTAIEPVLVDRINEHFRMDSDLYQKALKWSHV